MIIKSILALSIILLAPFQQVSIIMAPPPLEVDPLLALDVETYLNETPPTETTNIFAISNVTTTTGGTYVSLVGLDPDTPAPYDWGMLTNVIWVGTILLDDGEFAPYAAPTPVPGSLEASQTAGPGGGPEIAFPWEIGKQALFGELGIHGANGFGQGYYAVDWVSGDDFGPDAAPPKVFASAAGTVDWICRDDSNQMSVRVYDGSNAFYYLHLVNDQNVDEGASYTRGQYLGALKYGTFDGACGSAQQSEKHYHVHWVFVPKDGYYQAEGWVLSFSDGKWHKGNAEVGVNQWMTGGGGSGGPDTPPGNDGNPVPGQIVRFWSYVLAGFRAVADFIFSYWPAQNNPSQAIESGLVRGITTGANGSSGVSRQWEYAKNIAGTMIRDANVMLVNDIINLMPFIYLFAAIFITQAVLWVIGAIILIVKFIRLIF